MVSLIWKIGLIVLCSLAVLIGLGAGFASLEKSIWAIATVGLLAIVVRNHVKSRRQNTST